MIQLELGNKSADISLHGGELVALYQGTQNILWHRDAKFWGASAPLLFPICGRLQDNTYFLDGTAYEMNIHGFARDMLFEVRRQSPASVTLRLTDNETTRACYPFAFDFEVTYTLQETGLVITFNITNRSDRNMPFSLGGHWGFVLSGPINEYSLHFDAPTALTREILDGAYLSGQSRSIQLPDGILPLNERICDDGTWVFREAPRSCTLHHGDKPTIRLEYPDTPHLLIWTLPDAPFVCIEPWNGLPDGATSGELSAKDSILLLSPTQSKKFTHRIIF